jgi:hypothetical protein
MVNSWINKKLIKRLNYEYPQVFIIFNSVEIKIKCRTDLYQYKIGPFKFFKIKQIINKKIKHPFFTQELSYNYYINLIKQKQKILIKDEISENQ